MISRIRNQKGSVLLVTGVSIFVLLGALGLAADLGRVYIVKSEAQAFADIAALAAAKDLNGKSSGIDAAKAEVSGSTNAYNFGTSTFASGIRTVEFGIKTSGATNCTGVTWTATPTSPYTSYGCVRVTVTPSVNLSFMPVLGTNYTQQVKGQATGAIVPQSFPAGGFMPFTPFAQNSSDPNFGYSVGQEYAFHWPGNVKTNQLCAGDKAAGFNMSDQVGGSTRGYFELQSASSISAAIQGAKQLSPLAIGDVLTMTNGNKQSETSALQARASYDTDQTPYSPVTTGVAPAYYGNDMRKVVMPVNNGPNGGPNGLAPYTVMGFASFLLYTSYPNSGNTPWCAIYMGTSTQGGSGGVFNVAGAYVVRLVQ